MPTTNPHNEYILQQIQTGHFKWTYTDIKFEEDLIRQLISRNKIKITKNDFKRVQKNTKWTVEQITTRGIKEIKKVIEHHGQNEINTDITTQRQTLELQEI